MLVVEFAIYLVLPLACIWYPDAMGDYTGVMRGQYINAESPGCLVCICGWFLLLMPILVPMIATLSRH
jgi:hypothetical protein